MDLADVERMETKNFFGSSWQVGDILLFAWLIQSDPTSSTNEYDCKVKLECFPLRDARRFLADWTHFGYQDAQQIVPVFVKIELKRKNHEQD